MATLLGRAKGFPNGTFEWDGRREVRTYEDAYEVQAANENEGPRTIVNSLGIPIGDPFFDDQFAFARRVGPAKRSPVNRLFWTVPVFYTTQFPQVELDDLLKAPDDRRLKRRWTSETMQELMTTDAINLDVPMVNSANEPIEATHDIPLPILTVERYKENFAHQEILDYVAHTNAAAFYGAPAKTALMVAIEAEEDAAEVFDGVLYDRVRYHIKFKIPVTEQNKGWFLRIVDMGTQHRDPLDTTKFVPYLTDETTADGVKSQITGPLDGFGNPLDDGDPLVILPDGTGFNEFKTADFDALLIGPND